MQKIVPVTELQREAGQILRRLRDSKEPVIITQRGRPAAVLIQPIGTGPSKKIWASSINWR